MAKKQKQSGSLIVVLPGDNVTEHISQTDSGEKPPKLGTGLLYDEASKQIYATQSGRLCTNRNAYFVRQNLRRYRPSLQDRVVGIVEDRMGGDGAGGDVYRVNINASHPATISNLSFEGATKRNRPALQTGQLIYARVSALHSCLDPELSCILGPHDAGVPRKDWMTNEGCYSELRGGTVTKISTGLARELLRPNCVVLAALSAAKIPFEVAIGVNGFLWIHSQLPEYTILIQNAIKNSEVLTEEQTRAMVKSLVYTVQKQIQQDRDAMDTSED